MQAIPEVVYDDAPPAVDPRARTAAVALLVAAGALLVAAASKSWLIAPGGGVGMLGVEHCRSAFCESTSWFDLPHVPGQVGMFATLGAVATLAFIVLAIHGAAVLLRGEPRKVLQGRLNAALALTAVGMAGFLASLIVGDVSHGLSLGWSSVVGFGGVTAAAIVTGTMIRPLAKE